MTEKEQKEALFNYQKETLQSNKRKRKRKRVKRILFVFVFAYILFVNDGKQIYLITRENMESKLW